MQRPPDRCVSRHCQKSSIFYKFISRCFYIFSCYSGLNFQDLMVRQGAIDSPPKCPIILGFECAGEIEQVGEGVEGFAVSSHICIFNIYLFINGGFFFASSKNKLHKCIAAKVLLLWRLAASLNCDCDIFASIFVWIHLVLFCKRAKIICDVF